MTSTSNSLASSTPDANASYAASSADEAIGYADANASYAPALSNSPTPKKSAKSAKSVNNAPTPSQKPKIQNPKPKIQNPPDSFRMSFAPLSLEEVYQLADDGVNGAIVVMSGMVRNQTDGKPVVALEYQAYEPMALNIFRQIAGEIREQWSDVTHVVIHHRTGKLTVGEVSVLVAVGCPHRSEAFAACQYGIDTLKHNAPIWKKEHWEDGSTSWVSIAACEEQEEC